MADDRLCTREILAQHVSQIKGGACVMPLLDHLQRRSVYLIGLLQ